MLKVEHVTTYGWEAAVRGMRNPMNSWEKSDSEFNFLFIKLGPNDEQLMKTLVQGGSVHAKFRRMINITMDIAAPLYWWKEFDTYKVGTVANSCSTMHKIQAKEFTEDDFSCEHLFTLKDVTFNDTFDPATDNTFAAVDVDGHMCYYTPLGFIRVTCDVLNRYRRLFLATGDKKYWWQMIQLLPSSYNQKRTVQLNYEVASHIYPDRKDHKLDEWHVLCDEFKNLPYSWLITGEDRDD